jgi:hypothetical protein
MATEKRKQDVAGLPVTAANVIVRKIIMMVILVSIERSMRMESNLKACKSLLNECGDARVETSVGLLVEEGGAMEEAVNGRYLLLLYVGLALALA